MIWKQELTNNVECQLQLRPVIHQPSQTATINHLLLMGTPDIRRQKSQPMAPKRLADVALLQSPLWPLRAVTWNLNQSHSRLPTQCCSPAPEAHSKPGRKDPGSPATATAALAPKDQSGTCGELAVACSQLLQGQGVQSPTVITVSS